jgi:hypothetical protein
MYLSNKIMFKTIINELKHNLSIIIGLENEWTVNPNLSHQPINAFFHNLVLILHCISNSRHWIKSVNYPLYHYKFSLMKNQFYMDLTLYQEWKILQVIHELKPKSLRHKLDRFGPILTKPTCGKIWIWCCVKEQAESLF